MARPDDPRKPPLSTHQGAGERLPVGGGYQLLHKIGQGAFGEVWRAEAPGGVEVAVKIISCTVKPGEARRELEALDVIKRLRHHNLLSLQAYFALPDRLIIVLELADGSLRARLRACQGAGQALPPADVLRYTLEAAEALDYLHEQKVQHRDVKPDNLLLLGNHVKVADFGLARVLETLGARSASQVGTPAYMAPEVWAGKLSPHSDQYSLAVSYAELRLGRFPIPYDHLANLMFAVLEGQAELDPLPAAEQVVLRRALAKEPGARYPSCTAFARALIERWRAGLLGRGSTLSSRGSAQAAPGRSGPVTLPTQAPNSQGTLLPPEPPNSRSSLEPSSADRAAPHARTGHRSVSRSDQPPVTPRQGRWPLKIAASALAIVLLLVAVFVGLARLRGSATPIEELYARADAAVKRNDYDQAVAELTTAIRTNPSRIESYLRRASCFADMEEYERAVTDYAKAIELDPSCLQAYSERGMLRYDYKHYREAGKDFSKCIELKPRDSTWYRLRAIASAAAGDYPAAVADLSRCIELQPNHLKYYALRYSLYRQLGQDAKAQADKEKADRLMRPSDEIKACYARANEAGANRAKSISELTAAIRLDPNRAESYSLRAQAYAHAGEYGSAIGDLNTAVSLDPDDGELYIDRADALMHQHQYDEAIADYTKAIQLLPDSPSLHHRNRGPAYAAAGNYGKAIADCSRAILLDPSLPAAYSHRAEIHARLGETAKAVADYSRAIDRDPAYYFYERRAECYAALGETAKADADREKAREIRKTSK